MIQFFCWNSSTSFWEIIQTLIDLTKFIYHKLTDCQLSLKSFFTFFSIFNLCNIVSIDDVHNFLLKYWMLGMSYSISGSILISFCLNISNLKLKCWNNTELKVMPFVKFLKKVPIKHSLTFLDNTLKLMFMSSNFFLEPEIV